jgi:hypothetical protein
MADARELPGDVEELRRLIARRDERIAQLEQQVRVLTRWAFAPKSERRPRGAVDPGALQGALLFPELIAAAERLADEQQVQGAVELRPPKEDRAPRKKRPARRQQFPPHLPVVRTTIELPEEQRRCACGCELFRIGEDVSRELERIELCVVHEIARTKYACKACQGSVRTAPGPDRVIDKGLLGVGFLSRTSFCSASRCTGPATAWRSSTGAGACRCRARCCASRPCVAPRSSHRSLSRSGRMRSPAASSRPTTRRW